MTVTLRVPPDPNVLVRVACCASIVVGLQVFLNRVSTFHSHHTYMCIAFFSVFTQTGCLPVLALFPLFACYSSFVCFLARTANLATSIETHRGVLETITARERSRVKTYTFLPLVDFRLRSGSRLRRQIGGRAIGRQEFSTRVNLNESRLIDDAIHFRF